MSVRTVEVAVLGAGPAGIASACLLRRRGHAVLVLGRSRSRALEGLSVRAHARLEALGLERAARSAAGPVPRLGGWGGRTLPAGAEYVVARARFDAALGEDARAHGVELNSHCARAVRAERGGWHILTAGGEWHARLVIDARGRRGRAALRRGPRLVAAARELRLEEPVPARTRLGALRQGWYWLVADGQGGAALQLVAAARGFARAGLPGALEAALGELRQADPALSSARFTGVAAARAADARLCDAAPASAYLRIGDAAVAADPLSGQGIGEALAWASAAGAATHTYMEGGAWELVARFLRERAGERFRHGADLAAAFYQEQATAGGEAFYHEVATGYGALGNARAAHEAASWELRPVLNGERIELRRVAVTAGQPRGVWRLGEVELAGLHDYVASEPRADAARAAAHLGSEVRAVADALAWLRRRQLLPPAAAWSTASPAEGNAS
jgi:flavin-dependent dehydrogenase